MTEITEADLPRFIPQVEYHIEHLVVGPDGYAGLAETLTRLSAVGWRLVAASNGVHYFEREIRGSDVRF